MPRIASLSRRLAGVADMKQTIEQLGLQLLVGAGGALLTYLAGADYHALGGYAAAAQGIAAVALSAWHTATGQNVGSHV
jgi:hypothetical protein